VSPHPPGYVELIQRLAELIEQWCGDFHGLPDLQWHEPDGTAFIGPLHGDALKYLAKSPDAMALLMWLDEQTDRKATLIQATIALQSLGHLRGGRPEPETTTRSAGMQHIEAMAYQTGTETRLPPAVCPHCGKGLDAVSGVGGETPSVGDLSVCCYCFGVIQFGEGLVLGALSEDAIDAMGAEYPESIATVREMRDIIRASKMKRPKRGVQA
jgi:hypothetical protein